MGMRPGANLVYGVLISSEKLEEYRNLLPDNEEREDLDITEIIQENYPNINVAFYDTDTYEDNFLYIKSFGVYGYGDFSSINPLELTVTDEDTQEIIDFLKEIKVNNPEFKWYLYATFN